MSIPSREKIAELLEIEAIYGQFKSTRKTAAHFQIGETSVRRALRQIADLRSTGSIKGLEPLTLAGGRDVPVEPIEMGLPRQGVRRYILTCAQNNTHIHQPIWDTILMMAEHYRADILVSRFTYNHNAYGKLSVKPGTDKTQETLWYAPEISKYIMDESVELAPGLIFCGEMNILPTAERPLRGFENYTRRKSGIFPHVKQAMESIATHKGDATKFNYTTGTVTQRNYIQKKAGLKAEFHHIYGALLVEVNELGEWWVRQLHADGYGVIYDLDLCFDGRCSKPSKSRTAAITWGDIHIPRNDKEFAEKAWGQGGILDTLQPEFQFMHDVLDFYARNHHEIKDPHRMFRRFCRSEDSVENEITQVCKFLRQESSRPNCSTIVVDSNHDNALTRWLATADYRLDPVNAIFFLSAQKRLYESIRDEEEDFHLLEWCAFPEEVPANIGFLRTDESFIICRDSSGGIECGLHGDLGPNGARGSASNLSKIGRKVNIGHSHSACIQDGLFQAGTSSLLDMGFNTGPSSWSHSFIVTYPNGKRTIVTMWHGKWRA